MERGGPACFAGDDAGERPGGGWRVVVWVLVSMDVAIVSLICCCNYAWRGDFRRVVDVIVLCCALRSLCFSFYSFSIAV